MTARRCASACKRRAEHFVDLHGLGCRRWPRAIRERGIDILVDVKGATYGSVMQVMAHRPAPVQVNWLGFPGTSGAAYIDYLIGDPVVTPARRTQLRRAASRRCRCCYQPNDSQRALPQAVSRGRSGACPSDALVLCGFHQSYKISRDVFDSWCRLLHALSRRGAVAACAGTPTCRPRLTSAAAQRRHRSGAARVRAAAAGRPASVAAGCRRHLSRTPGPATPTPPRARPVGSACRRCTLIGDTPSRSGVAASLLHASGLPEAGVPRRRRTTNAHRARASSRTAAPRRAARAADRASDAGPLFDGARFARRHRSACTERMWARAVAGQAARSPDGATEPRLGRRCQGSGQYADLPADLGISGACAYISTPTRGVGACSAGHDDPESTPHMSKLPDIHLCIRAAVGLRAFARVALTRRATSGYQFRRFGARVSMAKNRLAPRRRELRVRRPPRIRCCASASGTPACSSTSSSSGEGGAKVSPAYLSLLASSARGRLRP